MFLVFTKPSFGGLNREDRERNSIASDTAATPEGTFDQYLKNRSEDRSLRWFFSNAPGQLKGVSLVIHGLNLRPDRMQPIITKLNESGIDVLRLSLRGHGDNYSREHGLDEDRARLNAFKGVSYQVWMNEAYWAYLQLKSRGEAKKVPYFLTAFSLGALIGLDMYASNADVRFDRLVLFAPAIRLHGIIYLQRVLSPFPGLVIPSLADSTYLSNKKGTPIAAYNALFDSLDSFDENADQKLNVPALVFIDKEDEFIPLEKLEKLVEEKGWDRWRFYLVDKDETADEDSFYHHIIDAHSTGQSTWQKMMKAVDEHLIGN